MDKLAIGEKVGNAFVDALVAAADQHDAVEHGQLGCYLLRETLALRREQNH